MSGSECPNGSVRFTNSRGETKTICAFCHLFGCEFCNRHIRRRLIRELEPHYFNAFVTLTLRDFWRLDPIAGRQLLIDKLETLTEWLRDHHIRFEIRYFWTIELTKRGTPHMHLLVHWPTIRNQQLSDEWNKLTGSFIVKIKPLYDLNGAIKYVAKYLTKDNWAPKGKRHFSRSRNIVPEVTDKQVEVLEEWQHTHWTSLSLPELSEIDIRRGLIPVPTGRWGTEARAPPLPRWVDRALEEANLNARYADKEWVVTSTRAVPQDVKERRMTAKRQLVKTGVLND
jgi:hypothetical protein